jgi:putative ABC transport system permease protein
MGASDITIAGLALIIAMLLPVGLIAYALKLRIIKDLWVSVFRMILQLVFAGFYLQFIFNLDNVFINMAYVLLMVFIAAYSASGSSGLKKTRFLFPLTLSILTTHFAVLLYMNLIISGLENVFNAVYLIPLGGMLLGNSLRGNIVGLNSFFQGLKSKQKEYLFRLSLGTTRIRALMPFIKEAIRSSLAPTVASMTTMGLVTLPGMMTGQILGGSPPLVAIKYQIAIMIGIYVVQFTSLILTLLFASQKAFDNYDMLDYGIFRKQ